MMHSVIYAPEAEEQLVALYFHLAAAASPEIATRFTDAIATQCESLQTFPMRGTRRDDIRLGLRVFELNVYGSDGYLRFPTLCAKNAQRMGHGNVSLTLESKTLYCFGK
jgi:plasmid stabilization system protein ParE